MSKLISVNINLDKVTVEKLFKGRTLNIIVSIPDEQDRFGNDAIIWECQNKYEFKEKKNYLGNGKIIYDSSIKSEVVCAVVEDELPF
jgi:hypothetical protein